LKFCPTCEVKMRRGADALSCPKCGHVDAPDGDPPGPTSDAALAASGPSSQGSAAAAAADNGDGTQGVGTLNVFDDSDEDESRSTIKIECEKCGNDEAVWWMLQTRSADEPTTQFYRCTKCRYTWRDYS